jgi:hypothetical protein
MNKLLRDYKQLKNIYDALKEGAFPKNPEGFNDEEWIKYLKDTKVCGLFKSVILRKNGIIESLVEKEIRKEYFRLLLFNRQRREEAVRIIGMLNDVGIVPTILKGIYLQDFIYPEGEIRPSDDIDIFVANKKEFQKAQEIIESLGYKQYIYQSKIWQAVFSKSFTYMNNKEHHYYPTYVNIDLHKELLFNNTDKRAYLNIPFKDEKLYEEAKYGNCSVKVMKKEAALAYLIFHHIKIHQLQNFIQIYDLLLFRRNNYIDWEKLKEITTRMNYWDETKRILDIVDTFFDEINEKELEFLVNESFKNTFLFKMRNVKGIHLKILWIYVWLLPSKQFLRSSNSKNKNYLFLRAKDLSTKINMIFEKLVQKK